MFVSRYFLFQTIFQPLLPFLFLFSLVFLFELVFHFLPTPISSDIFLYSTNLCHDDALVEKLITSHLDLRGLLWCVLWAWQEEVMELVDIGRENVRRCGVSEKRKVQFLSLLQKDLAVGLKWMTTEQVQQVQWAVIGMEVYFQMDEWVCQVFRCVLENNWFWNGYVIRSALC